MQYVVYKITCNSPNIDHLYVGSTENLEQRTYKHNYHSNRETNKIKLYTTIRAYDGFDNWTLEVVESGTVDTRFEIKSRERYDYDKLQPSLNMIRPQASKEEIRLDELETMRQYKSQNKEKLKENNRLYRLKNKDKIKEYERKYKSQNKDRIEQKVHCETCNCEIRKSNLARHLKNNQHLKKLRIE